MERSDPSPETLGFEHVFEPGQDPDPAYTGLLLHGTGASHHDLLPLGRAVASGKPLLSPLGKVREQGMPRWFRRLDEGVFDEGSIRERAAELASFLPKAAEAYGLDAGRFVAIGFSNGANIAASLLLLHPHALRGAVLLRAMTPLKPQTLGGLSGVPILILSGQQDALIEPEDAKRLARMLDEAGADVTHEFSNASHQLEGEEIERIRRWLADHEEELARPREGTT